MTRATELLAALDASPIVRLRWMADAIKSDPAMRQLLSTTADAWANGDRSPLAIAALGLANSVWADMRQGIVATGVGGS